MTDLNASLLSDKYNLYLEKAKKEQANGNLALARRNYLLAAETLMRLAKISSEKLRQTRVQKAKGLTVLAENLTISKQAKPSEAKSEKLKMDEQVKQWQVASIPNVRFDDVIGLDEVKRSIAIRMINPIKFPDKYKIYNKKSGGGVLLYGPPGTGKTMIAKAIANEVQAKFYVIKGSDIVSKWVGESEKNINALFEQTKKDDLAIIFIDEMDSLIGTRGLDPHNDKRVNEFLQQIDGFASKSSNLLLLGATNRPWDIDLAAMRSGRFSEKIYVPLPDEKARKYLFEKFLKDLPLSQDVDIAQMVESTNNYSGADIEEVCERAKEEPLLQAIKTDQIVLISKNDFLSAITSVKPTVDEVSLAKFEEFAKK